MGGVAIYSVIRSPQVGWHAVWTASKPLRSDMIRDLNGPAMEHQAPRGCISWRGIDRTSLMAVGTQISQWGPASTPATRPVRQHAEQLPPFSSWRWLGHLLRPSRSVGQISNNEGAVQPTFLSVSFHLLSSASLQSVLPTVKIAVLHQFTCAIVFYIQSQLPTASAARKTQRATSFLCCSATSSPSLRRQSPQS